ncbi:MAG TPA: sensor histidine kinase [Trebonia sp.]|jgi:signal transduction histidine kinase
MDTDAVRSTAATFVTGTTNPPPPRHRRLRRGRLDLVEAADVIIALICFGASNSWLQTENVKAHAGYGIGTLVLAAFVTSAPLVLRTRAPLTSWLASALAIVAASVVIVPRVLTSPHAYIPGSLVVYCLCLYAVTVRCKPRIVVAVTAATIVGGALLDWGTVAAAVFLPAVPLLLGILVRMWRANARQLAEQERRHSGERALLEERQRIARELHDVVAHHMSVIAIQAEAAPYKTADPPAELVESFGDIRATALTGLGELRRLLGVLRTGGPDIAPQPGLADLDGLLDSARGGGVTVAAVTSGVPVPLPDGVDLSAYRIVQEALSNAMRHAPGSQVSVRVAYLPDRLVLEVRNDGGQPAADPHDAGGGHGIIGMRERTAMLGGSLRAGPAADGGFLVTAILPVREPSQGDAA